MDNFYIVGGALRFDHPSYVFREADSKLYELLRKREYCYVFNSRQMGKSSLKFRISRRLRDDGIKCAITDLGLLGKYETKEKWYEGFATQILDTLALDVIDILNNWWHKYKNLPENQRLNRFFKEVVFEHISQNIVVFIDEIDSIIDIPFKDDFFSFIRTCYNHRADDSGFSRLSFCLLGVATPNDLIQDKNFTPFNVGRSIELAPLTFDESKSSLISGFSPNFNDPEATLKSILDWTGGQPFLTQKLCDLVVNYAKGDSSNISEIAYKYIIQNWTSQDSPEHIGTILNRVLANPDRVIGLIGLYQQILQTSNVPADNSALQNELCLTGLVVRRQGRLVVYNNIYAAIFNKTWVEKELKKIHPYVVKLKRWIEAGDQNEQYLLKEEELDEYSAWAEGKQLSNDDYRFLKASQQSALIEIRTELNSEKVRLKKYQRTSWIVLGALVIIIVFITWLGFMLNKSSIIEALRGISFFAREHNLYLIATSTNEFAILIDPKFIPAYYDLGYTYSEMGKDDKAFPFLDTAVNTFKDKNAYASYSRLLIRRQEYIKAEKIILRALEEDKNKHYYHPLQLAGLYQYLGWAQSEQKYKKKLAEQNLLKSISLDKQNATPYCLLAKIFQKEKARYQEQKYWKSCLAFANSEGLAHLDQKIWIETAKRRLEDILK